MNLQGKTVAVTGASGMIGVYICRRLLRYVEETKSALPVASD